MQEDKETVEETENIINVDEHQIFEVYEELIDIIANFEDQGSSDRFKLIDLQNNFIKLFGEHIFIKHYRKENNIPTPTPQYKIGDRMYIRYLNMVGTIDIVMGYNEEKDGIFYHLKVEPKGVATAREEWLMPYTEYQNLQNETRQ